MADIEIDESATADQLIANVLAAGYQLHNLSNTVFVDFWYCKIGNKAGYADWGRGATPSEAMQRAFHGARSSVLPDLQTPEDDGASLLE